MAIETLLISMMVGVYSLAEKARNNARQMRKHEKDIREWHTRYGQ